MTSSHAKRNFLWKIGALALVVLAFSSKAAYAWDWNGIDLMPYAGLSEVYDDNVTFRKNDPISDWITSLSGGLAAKYQTELTTFEVLGGLTYEWFGNHSEFDNLSGDVTADWQQELSRYDRFHARDHYMHSDEATSFFDAFNKSAGRYTYQTNEFDFDYTHDFTSQWSGVVRYVNDLAVFSTNLYNDSYGNSVGAGAIYHYSSATYYTFDYDFKIRDFSDSRDATDNSLTAGVRHYLTKQLYADGRVGLDIIDAYDGTGYTDPLYEAKLTDDIDARTSVDVAYENEYSLNPYTEDIFRHWQVSSSLSHEWTKRLSSRASVFYGDGEYVTIDRTDKLAGVNVSFMYDLTKTWKVIAKYNYTHVSSSDSSQEYTKNVGIVGFLYNF